MSETESKSPAVLQAQVAAFAAERFEHYKDRDYIFNNLGAIVLNDGTEDLTRVTVDAEHHTGTSGETVRVPEGTLRTVARTEDYVDFMRSVGGSSYEGIKGRAELLTAYNNFKPDIDTLREEIADPATRNNHPNFLGSGSNAMAFSIEHDGKKYAVRVPRGGSVKPETIDSHLGGAVLGRGVPHLEQVIAASYEDGVTIAEMMPGKEVGNLTVGEVAQVTDVQVNELLDTLIMVHERGIEIDPKPSNLFYDVEHGYGLIDYHSSKDAGKGSTDQTLGDIVGWMATSIENAGRYGKPYVSEKSAEDYAQEVAFAKVNFEVLRKYRVAVESKLTGKDQGMALEQIDQKLESIEDKVTNPDWIAEQVVQDQEQKQRREEQNKRADLDPLHDFV